MDKPVATRAAGQALLSQFTPRMGIDYAKHRNFDHGAGQHQFVSCLSPYVRRRLILEEELVDCAVSCHGLSGAEKFVQEVFWRTYFKGWLELRPAVWDQYQTGLREDLHLLKGDTALAKRVAAAEKGATGLDCFDAWAKELVQTGYLHNHARMWFASIWIFTLGLPWRIGADFFYRHLLDGDPASNTLSWRWVAGLHTRGKAYAAEAWNISKFTGDRFRPGPADLALNVTPLDHTEPGGLPSIQALRTPLLPDPNLPALLLITEEDCCIEDFGLDKFDVRATVAIKASNCRSPRGVSDQVQAFEAQALEDTAARNQLNPVWLSSESIGLLPELSKDCGARQIITPFVTQGPLRNLLTGIQAALQAHGINIYEWQRDWDRKTWPHATAGFFKVKQQIPEILSGVEAAN
jgi:deoxyribodipyrimidine photo-lyase